MMKFFVLATILILLLGCSTMGVKNHNIEMNNCDFITDLEMATVSYAAYNGKQSLDTFTQVVEIVDEGTGTVAYISINDNKQIFVLSFRGTEKSKIDLRTDSKFIKNEHKGLRVHRGFLKAYLSVEEEINELIKYIPTNYKFYITGHSLGGALACLAALYGERVPNLLVTFGQPRVGDRNTAKALSKIYYKRYVNHADAMARIPRVNYFHGGDLIYLDEKGDYHINPSAFFMFFDRLGSFEHRFVDHRILKYTNKLIKIINRKSP